MKYVVRDPQGNPHEVEAPEGASDAELISLAQQKAQAPAPKPVAETPAAPEKKSILDIMKPELFGGFDEAMSKLAGRSGGYFTDKLTEWGAPPEVAAGAGYAANVGVQAAPMALGLGAGKAVEPIAQAGARGLMQSALKPSLKNALNGKAARAIDTMLEEGISVSPGGLQKLQQNISQLNSEVMREIAASTATIDKNAAAQALNAAIHKFSRQANPQADLKTIASAWQEFVNHPLFRGQTQVPVQLAQQIKQGTQAKVADAYGELSSAAKEAYKNLARGLRQEIERVVPQVGALNKRESELLNARLLTEVRLMGEANKDPGGMAFLANSPAQALGWLAARSSWIKSLLARGLYKGAPTAGAAAGAAYGSSVSGVE